MVTVTANLNGTAEFAVPQASDYTNLSTLTFSTADGILTAGETVTLPVGTEITVSATAAEGYQVSTITVLDEPVANGGTFVLSGSLSKDDIDIITGQNSYALTVSNDMNFPYTLALSLIHIFGVAILFVLFKIAGIVVADVEGQLQIALPHIG